VPARCQLESTAVTARTIRNSLSRAAAQLPDDRPSVILVSCSERLVRSRDLTESRCTLEEILASPFDPETQALVDGTARRFLATHPEIVAVIFFGSVHIFTPTETRNGYSVGIVRNPTATHAARFPAAEYFTPARREELEHRWTYLEPICPLPP
jgi:hypothetical protein